MEVYAPDDRGRGLLLVMLALLPGLALAHQSLAGISMSKDVTCRVGLGRNCPGPCPNLPKDRRWDVNQDNPPIVVERGGTVWVGNLRNNHVGGFGRWSLVHVRDMMNKHVHARNAFRYDCADSGRHKCSERYFDRDCLYDQKGLTYTTPLKIPKVYEDGVYVLGWVWYGGVNENAYNGDFGDYHDCSFVEVRGGPREKQFTPEFVPGGVTSRQGKCLATVNAVGLCYKQPCPKASWSPYTSLAKLWKPREFVNAVPKPLYAWQFKNPHRIPKPKVRIKSMTIWKLRGGQLGQRIYRTWLNPGSHKPYLAIRTNMGLTITCETEGDVHYVLFYTNGKHRTRDYSWPYSIALDWKVGPNKSPRYAPYRHIIDNTITHLACRAVDRDGNSAWKNMELTTR